MCYYLNILNEFNCVHWIFYFLAILYFFKIEKKKTADSTVKKKNQ